MVAHIGMVSGKAKWEALLASPGTTVIELVCVAPSYRINLVAMFVCVTWGRFWRGRYPKRDVFDAPMVSLVGIWGLSTLGLPWRLGGLKVKVVV